MGPILVEKQWLIKSIHGEGISEGSCWGASPWPRRFPPIFKGRPGGLIMFYMGGGVRGGL